MQHVAVKEILFKSEVELLCSGKTDAAKWWFPPHTFFGKRSFEIPVIAWLALSYAIALSHVLPFTLPFAKCSKGSTIIK